MLPLSGGARFFQGLPLTVLVRDAMSASSLGVFVTEPKGLRFARPPQPRPVLPLLGIRDTRGLKGPSAPAQHGCPHPLSPPLSPSVSATSMTNLPSLQTPDFKNQPYVPL